MARCVEDLQYEIVDGADVAPRLQRRFGRRLDRVQVNAVRREVATGRQTDDLRRPRPCEHERFTQTLALIGAHRAVVELEGEEAHAVALAIVDLAPASEVRRCDRVQVQMRCGPLIFAENVCCWEFYAVVAQLGVRDPDGAVDRADAQRPVPLANHGTRRTVHVLFFVCAIHVHVAAEEVGEHPEDCCPRRGLYGRFRASCRVPS